MIKSCCAAALLSLALLGCAQPTSPQILESQARVSGWSDSFSGTALSSRWIRSSWSGFWQRNGISGGWSPQNAYLNGQGQLVLQLDVTETAPGQFTAQGAELQSAAAYGYGRYAYRMRAASTSRDPAVAGQVLSGTISAAFSYVNNSETEIDIELESRSPSVATLGAWKTPSVHAYSEVAGPSNLASGWHDYVYEWRADRLKFYIDGALVWQSSVVPSRAGYVMLNVWPTNETGWGGLLTPGTRYLLVDSVSFTPL